MREINADQIGTALRGMAEDLALARRRIAKLERENLALRQEISSLRLATSDQSVGPEDLVKTVIRTEQLAAAVRPRAK